jgi:hypothetical protein
MRNGARKVDFLLGRLSGEIPGSFGLQPAVSPEMREKIALLEQDQRYASARKAILDCVTGGPGWQAVLDGRATHPDPDLLTTLACATVFSGHLSRKGSLDAVAVEETGKSWKALGEFPNRIEAVAREMEKVNGGLLAPENQIDAEAPDAERFRQSFRDLPSMLRVWAKALAERISAIRRLDAAVFGDSNPRDYLQFLVKNSTGKPNDRLVANLLNAAAGALGKTHGFDVTSLAKARLRRRKKSPNQI